MVPLPQARAAPERPEGSVLHAAREQPLARASRFAGLRWRGPARVQRRQRDLAA